MKTDTITKHTPGPWTLEGTSPNSAIVVVKGAPNPINGTPATYVASVEKMTHRDPMHASKGTGEPEGLANARLIGAAPDLLAALREVYEAMIDHPCFSEVFETPEGLRYIPAGRAVAAIGKALYPQP